MRGQDVRKLYLVAHLFECVAGVSESKKPALLEGKA